ncbi:4-hydroxy-tetrahydrodipicolinate synthase [Novipirellula galeiformis]|uniref:4-hydroxy-tetrahydrodipicolinate synthase n=1 Tax=Novipirellula galeiformis TaxID=2528004 RepID=A0A5C6C1R7_9BACT|nr:dihydrodipicolinate synthase family protein [Novipirellula galeiformis]TWU17154.1 4-hydroxy-tetrahydrodipicolinate synthase [Novipirellula galeiformis]
MPSTVREPLSGVLPVLHTPFTDAGEIDCVTLEREIDWAFQTGAQGVVTAMVSEVLRLGYHGRKQLAEQVCEATGQRGFTVISVGAESTNEAIDFAQHAERIGASAVMAIPPVATQLGGAATRDYFAAIASSISIPLVVQDASGYVGAAIDLGVYLDLLEQFGSDRILFKPEASPLGPNLSKLRDATAGEARIFEGSGGINLVDCYRRGIAGTMPGTDLLDAIVALWQALQAGEDDRIYQLSLPLCGIVALQLQGGLDGFLAIEKYLLKQRGLFPNTHQVQPTAWQIDEETQAEVDRLFARLQAAI